MSYLSKRANAANDAVEAAAGLPEVRLCVSTPLIPAVAMCRQPVYGRGEGVFCPCIWGLVEYATRELYPVSSCNMASRDSMWDTQRQMKKEEGNHITAKEGVKGSSQHSFTLICKGSMAEACLQVMQAFHRLCTQPQCPVLLLTCHGEGLPAADHPICHLLFGLLPLQS